MNWYHWLNIPTRLFPCWLMKSDTSDTVTPSVVSGRDGEFIHAPRLDNLASCHAALTALIEAADAGPAEATRGFIFNDHEEVGSMSTVGA